MINHSIRAAVRGVYDLQKLRIQCGLRVVATFKTKLGQAPGEPERELTTEAKNLLKELRQSHTRITDALAENKRSIKMFPKDGLIDSFSEYALLSQYVDLERTESEQFKFLEKTLKDIPIYSEFLKEVKGVGPAMAGVIISEMDIHKARYAQSLWKYAGLDVAADGQGRSRRKEHLETIKYINKEGKEAEKQGITFNPFLKTKLVGVLGASFLRAGQNPYRTIYDRYKHRLEHHVEHKEKTKGHRHNMAIRYMIKRFLCDLYLKWRELEGLKVSEEYAVAKLGLRHNG